MNFKVNVRNKFEDIEKREGGGWDIDGDSDILNTQDDDNPQRPYEVYINEVSFKFYFNW